jgi:gamma-glutamyl-gamma-aminobutyrate hydrolase PuuD
MSLKYSIDTYDPLIMAMLKEDRGYVKTDVDPDFYMFTGGADIDPDLYGEVRHPSVWYDRDRDDDCLSLYYEAKDRGKPMVGICRGSQFLCAMAGNRLWQDVPHHAISGEHSATCLVYDETLFVTSTHHQMMRMQTTTASGSYVLMVADVLGVQGNRASMSDPDEDGEQQIEAMMHPQDRSMSYQPHPEYVDSKHMCRVKFWEYFNLLEADK